MLRGGVLCTDQDSLEAGLSRETSANAGRPPAASLAVAVKEDWVGHAGPSSHPLRDAGAGEEEGMPADDEDEFEGAPVRCCALCPVPCCSFAPPLPIHRQACPLHGPCPLPAHPNTTPAGVCAANASSDEYSDVEEGGGHTEVVFVKASVPRHVLERPG